MTQYDYRPLHYQISSEDFPSATAGGPIAVADQRSLSDYIRSYRRVVDGSDNQAPTMGRNGSSEGPDWAQCVRFRTFGCSIVRNASAISDIRAMNRHDRDALSQQELSHNLKYSSRSYSASGLKGARPRAATL